jgi:hypothetical protein
MQPRYNLNGAITSAAVLVVILVMVCLLAVHAPTRFDIRANEIDHQPRSDSGHSVHFDPGPELIKKCRESVTSAPGLLTLINQEWFQEDWITSEAVALSLPPKFANGQPVVGIHTIIITPPSLAEANESIMIAVRPSISQEEWNKMLNSRVSVSSVFSPIDIEGFTLMAKVPTEKGFGAMIHPYEYFPNSVKN